MLNIQKLVAIKRQQQRYVFIYKKLAIVSNITIIILVIIKLLDLLERSSLYLLDHLFPHATSVPVLQLHRMNFETLSGPGNIGHYWVAHDISDFRLPLCYFRFFFYLSFSMFPSANILTNYGKKLLQEMVVKQLDSLSFSFSGQCLGILHVLPVLMIPIFLII